MKTAREETTRLADLLRREHHALAEFLLALAEFDRGRRWVDLGYRSLFDFLTRELGLPKGPAYYRMTAAGLIQRYPELVEPLRDGRLHLTSVGELSKVITPENRAEVLPRFFHASKREAKEVVAELRPVEVPPARTIVTAVRAAAGSGAAAITVGTVLPEEPRACQLFVPDVARPAVKDAPPSPPARARAEVEPMTADLRRLHLTVSRRLLEKLSAARDALSHSHPSASDDEILELGLDLIVERHRKRRGIGCKPRGRATTTTSTTTCQVADADPRKTSADPGSPRPAPRKRSRHVPAAVWRAVWERDGGRCVWPIDGGGVCGATRQVELDHVDGWALGAATTAEECRLLCRTHQDVSARALYGDELMNRYTGPKGPGCSEPVAAYSPRIGHPWATTFTSWSGWRARSSAAYSSARSGLRVPQPGGSSRSSAASTGEAQAGSPSTVTWKTVVATARPRGPARA